MRPEAGGAAGVRTAAGRAPCGRRLWPAPPPATFAGTLPSSDPVHGQNIRWAEYNGLLAGITLGGWDVWSGCRRGEVAQIPWNLVK